MAGNLTAGTRLAGLQLLGAWTKRSRVLGRLRNGELVTSRAELVGAGIESDCIFETGPYVYCLASGCHTSCHRALELRCQTVRPLYFDGTVE